MSDAASVLERDDYLKAAVSNATFLTEALYDGKFLQHTYKDGQAKIDGYLSDYALLSEGLISLYQATFAERWLQLALKLSDTMLSQFWDEGKGHFHDVSHGHETPLVRPRNTSDNAVPSGSSAAVFVLLRLARLIDNRDYERVAATAMRSVQEIMVRYPPAFGHWLCALDAYLSKPLEIVVIGNPEDTATKSLMRVINNRYSPNKILAVRKPEEDCQIDIPLLRDRSMIGSRPAVYVCENHVCKMPVNESDALAGMLDKLC
jgi:uncharacterized protein YyaL (SSP411 family)